MPFCLIYTAYMRQNKRPLHLSQDCTHIVVRTSCFKTLIIFALYALFDAEISDGNAAMCSSPRTTEESLWCGRTWHEVMSLSRCRVILHRLKHFQSASFIVFLQYAPLSLRPLTCEVKGHRLGPLEQSCIQFQRLKTKEMVSRVLFSLFESGCY